MAKSQTHKALKILRNVYNYLFFLVATPLVPITQGEDLILADLPQFVNQTMPGGSRLRSYAIEQVILSDRRFYGMMTDVIWRASLFSLM